MRFRPRMLNRGAFSGAKRKPLNLDTTPGTLQDITTPKTALPATPKVDFEKYIDYSIVKGKTAIVLDGAHGLGLGVATELAAQGAKVAMCDPSEEACDKAEKELSGKGYTVRSFKCETSDWESQSGAFKDILAWSGDQLDIVVTSPGIVTNNLLMSILPKHHPDGHPSKPPTKCLEVSLLGVYYSAILALFYFNRFHTGKPVEDFRPQLLFICSMAGFDGLEFGSDYAAAKHGVRAIWKTTRRPRPSMARYQSNLLAPTYIKSGPIKKSEADVKDHQNQMNEIADVVAGAMRCICDETVEGRALACVQGSIGTAGQLNFDLCDDVIDGNGGKRLLDKVDDIWLPSSAKLSEDSNCAVQ